VLVGEFVGRYDAETHAFSIVPAPSKGDGTTLQDEAWSLTSSGLVTFNTVGSAYVDKNTNATQGTAPSCALSTASNCGKNNTAACKEAICATVSLQAGASATFTTVDVQVAGVTGNIVVESDDTSTTPVTTSEQDGGITSSPIGLWRWSGATAL